MGERENDRRYKSRRPRAAHEPQQAQEEEVLQQGLLHERKNNVARIALKKLYGAVGRVQRVDKDGNEHGERGCQQGSAHNPAGARQIGEAQAHGLPAGKGEPCGCDDKDCGGEVGPLLPGARCPDDDENEHVANAKLHQVAACVVRRDGALRLKGRSVSGSHSRYYNF